MIRDLILRGEVAVVGLGLIDAALRRLAPQYPDAIVIDRDGMEFHERGGLLDIIRAAGLPMFHEIPYERMDR